MNYNKQIILGLGIFLTLLTNAIYAEPTPTPQLILPTPLMSVVGANESALNLEPSTNGTGQPESLANKANNPLTPLSALIFQNYVQTGVNGASNPGDTLNVRYAQHIKPNKVIPVPQLFRLELPVSVVPMPNGSSIAGLGGASLFDTFILKQTGVEFGIGPAMTLPTSTRAPYTGPNTTEAGGAIITSYHKPRYLLGAVIQGQGSFTWSHGQPTNSFVSVQPISSYNLADGYYLRSTGIWNFNFAPGNNKQYYIPLGLGAGKAWRMKDMIFNFYAEPQPTVIHGGAGDPKFQFLTGLNIMFNA